jgi:nicotinamide-nucleotide amidase
VSSHDAAAASHHVTDGVIEAVDDERVPMSEHTDRPAAAIEILTIGDELLRGDLVDSNSAWLATQLLTLGLPVTRIASVGDEADDIANALGEASERASVVITSGGLGPTDDDRTIGALAQAASVELVRDEAALAHVKARFARAGLTLTPNNESQAWVPAGAAVLLNEQGTAPAVRLAMPNSRGGAGCHVICLPGVPRELKWLYGHYVEPWLRDEYGARVAVRRTLKVFGIGESNVDHALDGLLDGVDGNCRSTTDRNVNGAHGDHVRHDVTLHYRATFPENHVTLLVRAAQGAPEASAVALADRLAAAAAERLGRYVFARDEAHGLADTLVAALREAEATVALAESCTGGRAADLVTNAAGSSQVFELGVVAYANRIKQQQLGVPEQLLAEHGAVSKACVEAMARGVRELAGSTYGIAISGVAGPGGGSADKPVGTVHFALDSASGTRHLHRVFAYDRDRNKLLAAYVALWMLVRELAGDSSAVDLLDGRWRKGR